MREFLGKCAWGVAVGAALSLVANVSEANWRRRADLPDPRSKHAAAIVGGKLYVMGGLDENHDLTSEMVRYDPRFNAWRDAGEMPNPRSWAATAVLDGMIYVLGGWALPQADRAALAERFDPRTGLWKRLSDMPDPSILPTAVTLGSQIYVIRSDGRPYRYDPELDAWSRGAESSTSYAAAAALGGHIYLFGGRPEKDVVLRYDPVDDRWSRRTPMPTPRVGARAVVVGRRIYVIGGDEVRELFDEVTNRTVEIYDPRTDTWAVGPSTILLHQTVPIVTESGVIYALGGLPLGAHVNALSDALEAWDTGIRAVSPGSHTLLTTWSALRSAN